VVSAFREPGPHARYSGDDFLGNAAVVLSHDMSLPCSSRTAPDISK